MRKAPKIIAALTLIPLTLGLSACGGGSDSTSQTCQKLSNVQLSSGQMDQKALDQMRQIAEDSKDSELSEALKSLADLAGKNASSATEEDTKKALENVTTITDKCPTLQNS